MIHFTSYRVIDENPCVSRLGCRKKLHDGSKNDWHLFWCLDMLYHHAKFGEDCTTCAGCRWENMVYVFFCIFVTLQGQSAVRLRGYTLSRFCVAVYWSFWCCFSVFIQKGLPFQMGYIVLIFVARWCYNFRKIAIKNEVEKSAEKFVRTTSYR